MIEDELIGRLARALQAQAPVLECDEARELAETALLIVSDPVRLGSTLGICRICRAPTRPKEAA